MTDDYWENLMKCSKEYRAQALWNMEQEIQAGWNPSEKDLENLQKLRESVR